MNIEEFELREVDLNKVDNEELVIAISSNLRKIDLVRAAIKKLQLEREPNEELKKETKNQEKSLKNNTEIEDFDKRIANINEQLNGLESSEWGNYLSLIPENEFQRVILGLKLLIHKNIKELKEYSDNPKQLSESDQKILKYELDYEENKLNYIDEYSKAQEESLEQSTIEEIESDQMRLIFIKNEQTGKYGIFDDISEIPTDIYKRFYYSFKALKRNQGGNIKPLTELYGLSEIKGKGTRIVFKKISNNCYAIVTAFLKKTDSDRRYSNNLLKKATEYKNKEDYLIESIKDEDFMREQLEIEKTLLESLATRKTYTASKVKSKVGENDGKDN